MEHHPSRGTVLAEVHARPFLPSPTPRRFVHFGFVTDAASSVADRARLSAYCEGLGLPAPVAQARHHRIELADAGLRWEQHSEFTTYTWEVDGEGGAFERPVRAASEAMARLGVPGALLVAVDLHLMPDAGAPAFEAVFDASSLAASSVDGDGALAATDFRPDSHGFVRILVLDRALTPPRAGALVQRLLEIETYRLFALLGLPEAQRLAPSVAGVEAALTRITGTMAESRELESDSALLDELTDLAATLEADATTAAFRFGASRAYDSIVEQRLEAIDERPVAGSPTIAAFLARRMAPAMRTCFALEARLADLSRRLAWSAELLRTRVDVQIERQNRDVLAALNERTRMQLRLQATVEGLSVAAVSYYVVALATYLWKGLRGAGFGPDPEVATAFSIPIVVGAVWVLVRRIRRRHVDADDP